MARRVFLLTGARSESGILGPVFQACLDHPDLDPAWILGAAQLSPWHGANAASLRGTGHTVAFEAESFLASDSWVGRSLSFAHLVAALSHGLSRDKPDILVVCGDREEALAGAVVGNFLRIPVAHLHGGDRCIASDVDEVFRPAISKLAHLHFVAAQEHHARLIGMGERPETVFHCGAPGLDRFRAVPEMPSEALSAAVGVDTSGPFFLVIHHPSSTLSTESGAIEIEAVLDGVLRAGHPVLCSYPNADPGNVRMREILDARVAVSSLLRLHHNLGELQFVNVYRRCSAVVGNSSSLLLESPFIGVPAILVGHRQDHRVCGLNTVRVPADADAIHTACRRAVEDPGWRAQAASCDSPYGDGASAPRIAAVLAAHVLTNDLLVKMMTY